MKKKYYGTVPNTIGKRSNKQDMIAESNGKMPAMSFMKQYPMNPKMEWDWINDTRGGIDEQIRSDMEGLRRQNARRKF